MVMEGSALLRLAMHIDILTAVGSAAVAVPACHDHPDVATLILDRVKAISLGLPCPSSPVSWSIATGSHA